jgi:DnaJ-class molecular chaperone
MKLHEMLSSPEAKRMYRELATKYHPDKTSGNEEIMKKINAAKDKGDDFMKELYSKYEYKDFSSKEGRSSIKKMKEYSNFAFMVEKILKDIIKVPVFISTRREGDKFSYAINLQGKTIYVKDLEKYTYDKLLDIIMKKITQ